MMSGMRAPLPTVSPLRSALALLLVFAPAASAATPQSGGSPAAPDELPAPPLAIDGVPVAWVELANWLVQIQGGYNLEEFVFDMLVQRAARRAELHVSLEEIDAEIDVDIDERVRTAFGGDRSLWVDELQRLGTDPESYRSERRIEERLTLTIDRLVQDQRVVLPEQVRLEWEDRYGPGGRALYASRLFVRVRAPGQPEGLTREESLAIGEEARRVAEERAGELYAELAAGADFDALVQEHSDDHITRKRGGKLPDPIVSADWPAADKTALRNWKLGEVLPPFLDGGGYNLLRLDRFEVTPFEDVAADLTLQLQLAPADQDELQVLRAELTEGVLIEYLPEVRREVTVEKPRLDRPVAQIDGMPLLRRDFANWLIRHRGHSFARTFMEHGVIARLAAEAGLEPTAIEIEQRVQADVERQIQLFSKGDRERWLQELTANGQSVEDFMQVAKMRTRHTLRAEALLRADRVVTEDDVRREWETRYGEGGNSLDVRVILRRLPRPPEGSLTTDDELRAYIAAETEKAMTFLSRLARRVRAGEDFDALARTYSEDPKTRDRGGRSEGRFELHTWTEDVQAQLRALAPGEVTEPLVYGGEFLLFELAGRVQVPLEDVAEGLREELRTRQPSQIEVSGFVNGLTQGIAVDVLPALYR